MKPVSIAPFGARSLSEGSAFEGALERLLESSGVGRPGFAVPRPVLAVPRPDEGRDPLTNLANRASFLARLARSTAPEWCVEGLFVLLLDVDGFRSINERFGYEAADALLAEMGARLKRRLRPGDTLARFGADSFAVLLAGFKSGEDVTDVVLRLQAEMSAPCVVDGRELRPQVSVGVAIGQPGARPEQIVRDAERALARAQLLGQSGASPYPAETNAREGPLQRIETALRRALEQDEFRVRYRPTVRRKEGSVPAFEIVLFKRG
jgi:diguanylate cyclase (GGDEF)-like protein